jgi:hypothetical protein
VADFSTLLTVYVVYPVPMINTAMKGGFDAEYLYSLVGRKEEGVETEDC